MAWGAAAWNFAGHASSSNSIWLGAAAYLALAGAGLAGLRRIHRRFGPRAFLWTAMAAAMLIQAAAILASDRQWEWTGDARIFSHYLDRLSENGYSPQTLGELSRNYDYPIWTRRALPFHYLLRVSAGDHFVRAVQFFQALLISLSLPLAWRMARLLFGKRVAFWATSLQFLMPFRWFICLDLNHYISGGFYFLSALWVLVEWSRTDRRRLGSWGLALCAAALFPLMRLEGGIDQIYLAAAAGIILLCWTGGTWTARQSAQAGLAWIAAPFLVSALLLPPLSSRIDEANRHRLSSGTIAFMARGWMPETGGEYSATYEQIDWLTPAGRKESVQASLLASQAFYNPRPLLFRLLPVKWAKYFLLGYASGAEEMLVHNGAERAALLAKGARIAYLLAALPCMLWGALLCLPLLRKANRLCWTLPGLLFCASTALVGETSPRYSIYIQPFLFMLGALPLAWSAGRRRVLARAAGRPGLWALASGLALFFFAAALLHAARPWLRPQSVLDMRSWTLASGTQAGNIPSTLAPLEIHLMPQVSPDKTDWGTLQLPAAPDTPGTLSFYALPAGVSVGSLQGTLLVAEYAFPGGTRTQTHSLPARIQLEYSPSSTGSLRLWSPAAATFPLSIGYATCEAAE